jgi:hypothetical protein
MNIPLTGNSGEKNIRKRPRLYLLATATLLLSIVSFIGVGAISQPQAFAQERTVEQTSEQVSVMDAEAGEGSEVRQHASQQHDQTAKTPRDYLIIQDSVQLTSQNANVGED